MNYKRIKSAWADPDLQAFLAEHKERLTGKVMSQNTSDDQRAEALADFHALRRLENKIGVDVQAAEDNADE